MPFEGGGKFYLAPHSNYNEYVAVNYLVYDFDRRKETLKLLQSNETTESEKINIIRDRLAYQTANVFYAMLYLKKNIEVMDRQIVDLLKHDAVARKLVLTGSATGLDTLTTNVKLIAFTNQKVDEINKLRKAEAAIKQAKGLYESGSITNTTLLDTEISLDQARLKYTYQLYLLTLSHYKLFQATGEKIW